MSPYLSPGSVSAIVRPSGGILLPADAELIDSFITWQAAGAAAESSMRQRRYLLRAFAREFPLLTATEADIVGYVARPVRAANGKRTVVSALRIFYSWACARDLLPRNPMALVHQVREVRPLPKPVPEDVLRAALKDADPEQRRAIILGAYSGLRVSEIAAFHSRTITDMGLVITGKGRVTRRIPIHPLLVPELDFTGWGFPSWRRVGDHVCVDYIANRVEDALGAPWTTHTLRHRFGTQTYRACHDIRTVQALLGHSSPNTTARYIALSNDDLQAAVLAVA